MTRNDLLDLVLAAADDVGRIFDHAEIQTWPAGALEALCRLGLLRPSQTGLYAPCPNCDGSHIEPVTMRVAPGGAKRFFIWCLEGMRVEIKPEMCNGWEVDIDGLARAIGVAMGLKSKPRPLVPGRLWSLGRTPWKKATREVVLAIRLRDKDASSVIPHIAAGGRSIIFVPQHLPEDQIWPGRVPGVVALSRVGTLEPAGLVLDVTAIWEIVTDADAAAEARSTLSTDPERKKLTTRQQLKAEIKSHLMDDLYVAAYKLHGSYNKAATALTQQTGQPVSRDKVFRAMKRHGGPIDAMAEEDSASAARSVASQRCNRAKKFLERS